MALRGSEVSATWFGRGVGPACCRIYSHIQHANFWDQRFLPARQPFVQLAPENEAIIRSDPWSLDPPSARRWKRAETAHFVSHPLDVDLHFGTRM